MLRMLPTLLLLLVWLPVQAEPPLTIERIFASPDLSGPSLRQAQLSPAGDRVTFLRARDDDRDLLDLWEYHIGDDQTRRLIAADQVLADEGELSLQEQARRERARIAGLRGIVEYRWSGDGRFLLFPLGGNIYLTDLVSEPPEVRQVTDGEDFDTDPGISPDGTRIAFIRDHDLWVAALDNDNGQARALTRDGDGLITNGVAEFIAQEEMGRDTGYWWSPDGTRIAFLRVDNSPVQLTRRFEIRADEIEIIEQRYPFTGTPNVSYRLGVVEVESGEIDWIDLGEEPDIYIPRVAWLPDGKRLSFQRQSRDQKRLELVIADLASETTRVVLTETADTWINLHDDLRFIDGMDAFLWSSERDGYRHLYLYRSDGELIRRLTTGNWAVDAVKGIDLELGLVYFTAAEASPREKHLYRQSLVTESPDAVTRLTRRSGWHQVRMDSSARVYVNTFSSTVQPPQLSLHSADGERLAWLVENRIDADHPYHPFRTAHQPTEFGEIIGPNGIPLHYRLIRPAGFEEGRRYPVFFHVYGGPTHRLVTNSWSRRVLIDQYIAGKGYVVFSLDNRGIVRQGKAFQDEAYLKLGRIEVIDQMIGLDFLRGLDFVDPDRIGVFGWSYGGYLALMLMMQHPGAFAAGVAVAPVTDWRLYDTHYTERYLGKPQDQPEAYDFGNVITHADQLSDSLLLIHGMADDNVLFTHSTLLMQKLQDEIIDFELMTYPGEKHAISGASARVHVYRAITGFLHRHLKEPSP